MFNLINKIKNKLSRNSAFRYDYQLFEQLNDGRFVLNKKDFFPCLVDSTVSTVFDPHYIYHPAWAVRILAQTKPVKHIDISSTLNFCAIVSAFVPVKFYDFRPAKLNLTNLSSEKADLTNLPFPNGSINSLSCMHTVEHVGLGRYGDPIDPIGDLKAINELKRVLAKGGDLLFVVPVGEPKIMFNAHRIYSYNQVVQYFAGLKLKQFSLVTDSGDFLSDVSSELVAKQNYGCGCFWFKRE